MPRRSSITIASSVFPTQRARQLLIIHKYQLNFLLLFGLSLILAEKPSERPPPGGQQAGKTIMMALNSEYRTVGSATTKSVIFVVVVKEVPIFG